MSGVGGVSGHWSSTIYRLLLRLYPRSVRRRFARDMAECYDDLLADARAEGALRVTALNLATLGELVASAAKAHLHEWRSPAAQAAGRALPEPPSRFGRRARTMDGIIRDLKYAWRALLRRPGLTSLAVLSMALGVGANTSMLAMVNSIVWKRLPVPNSEQIVRVYEDRDGDYRRLSFANYRDLREQSSEVLEDLLLHRLETFGLQSSGPSEVVYGELVSASYFDTLQVKPARGRLFTDAETGLQGATPVVVIGYDLWNRRFSFDPEVVGTTLLLNGRPFEVIGVAEREFDGTKFGLGLDLWVPILPWAEGAGWPPGWDERRGAHSWLAVARLRSGTTRSEAGELLDTVGSRLEELAPEDNRNLGFALFDEIDGSIDPHVAGMPRLIGLLAIGAASLVLLVACANVASLLYTRAISQRRETGLRSALGAGRLRLLRQLLSESFLLSLLGGAVGIAAAFWTGRLLLAFLPSLPYRFVVDPRPDPLVVLLGFALAVLAAAIAGLAPALKASSSSPLVVMRGDGDHGGAIGHRGLNIVVVSMVAVSFVSLVLSGLFFRSLEQVRRIDPGFSRDNRVVATFDTSLSGDPELRPEDFARDLEARTLEVPGVSAAAVSSVMPLGDRSSSYRAFADDRVYGEDEPGIEAWQASVTPELFEVMGIELLAGRTFGPEDRAEGAQVLIINQTLADRLWPESDAVGRRIRFSRLPSELTMEVVGVVADAKYAYLNERNQPALFRPFAQSPRQLAVLVAETDGAPEPWVAELEKTLRAFDPRVPVLDVKTVDRHVEGSLWLFRMGAGLAAALGLLALGLSAAGLYGTMAHSVNERRHELGIRQALGAATLQVLRMVFAQGLLLTLLGMGIGLIAALALGRLLTSVLYGIVPGDPPTLIGVAATLCLIAGLATLVPALAASRCDPVETLRES